MSSSDEVLELRELEVRVSGDEVEIEGPAGRCTLPLEGLFGLLAAFERPSSVREVMASVPVRGAAEWAERAGALMALRSAGVLAGQEASPISGRGFSDPAIHVQMLDDTARVSSFAAAIQAVVGPEDVVVDLGTGTGILAVVAARAGARHVFAIEETPIADIAAEVFARNGVADRITLIRGHSTGVTLPERGSVLVTETLGNDPLGERILPYVADARRRLLRPDARLIPSALHLTVQALDVGRAGAPVLTEETIARWRQQHGVDLGPLLERHPRAFVRTSAASGSEEPFPRCSAPAILEVIDLARDVAPSREAQVTLVATGDADQLGLALGYDARLAPDIVLTVGPEAPPGSHWRAPVFTRMTPSPVATGQDLKVRYARDRVGCKVDLANV